VKRSPEGRSDQKREAFKEESTPEILAQKAGENSGQGGREKLVRGGSLSSLAVAEARRRWGVTDRNQIGRSLDFFEL